jgi:hypothetical protein
MKHIALGFVIAGMLIMGIPSASHAQDSLRLYDSLSAKTLDPTLWFGSDNIASGGTTLEVKRCTKLDPLFGYIGLDLLNRSYGSRLNDTDITNEATRLNFSDGSGISTIVATVQVKKVTVTGCDANAILSETRARIGGFFFNTSTPTPGSAMNDVYAYISLVRRSDSTDPADVLNVFAYIGQCHDNGCLTSTILGTQDLGTAKMNKRIKLRVSWNQAGHSFIFQKKAEAEVAIDYVVSDANPPGAANGGLKRLEINHKLADCASGPATTGYMDVIFNNVYVNQ